MKSFCLFNRWNRLYELENPTDNGTIWPKKKLRKSKYMNILKSSYRDVPINASPNLYERRNHVSYAPVEKHTLGVIAPSVMVPRDNPHGSFELLHSFLGIHLKSVISFILSSSQKPRIYFSFSRMHPSFYITFGILGTDKKKHFKSEHTT